MAKIRAYKLAEELKLDRDEFLKKAADLGIRLRSHMVGVDDEDAEMLRRRLGGQVEGRTEQKRLAGGTVIRRRRKAQKPPKSVEARPEPQVQVEAPAAQASPVQVEGEVSEAVGDEAQAAVAASVAVEAEAPAVSAEAPLAEGVPAAEATAEVAAAAPAAAESEAPARVAASREAAGERKRVASADDRDTYESESFDEDDDGPEFEPEPMPTPTPTTSAHPDPIRRGPATPNMVAPGGFAESPGAKGQKVRRTATQEMNLREQDSMARTMLGNVQRRLEQRRMIVEHQSRMAPGRRVRSKNSPKQLPARRKKPMIVRVSGTDAPFKEIARQTGIKIRDLFRTARAAGIDCDRDGRVSLETIELIGTELGFEVEQVRTEIEAVEAQLSHAAAVDDSDLALRPPVVTVMGHVDHGKTSLLDYIRKTKVTEGESGGITQHIGAYSAQAGDSTITFIDTPGHAAFTQMRARGAQVTDIVVLVVAADDGVMPQTVEAINHARAAGVPIIVAVNKIDLPDANPQRIKQALLEHKIVAEDFGGDTIVVEVSAAKGTGVDKLLEMLALQAEILELKARDTGPARGFVVEARLDRGRGPVATVLVKEGTLSRGDAIVVGDVYGRVRTMTDSLGKQLKKVGPSTPVQLVGLSGVPDAGDELAVVKNEREAKGVAEHRIAERKRAAAEQSTAPLEADIFAPLGGEEGKELRLVLKSDVHGTMEAVREGVENLSTDRVKVKVIHTSVGPIGESDIMLASASSAVVLGFHVRPEPAARKAAEREKVEIRCFDIVYELFDETKSLMEGLLPPKLVETISGHAQVRELFTVPRLGTIAGCQVPEGVIRRNNSIRVLRDGVPVYTGRVESLRRFKDDVREVAAPLECGIKVENFNDIKVGDILESFRVEERPDSL